MSDKAKQLSATVGEVVPLAAAIDAITLRRDNGGGSASYKMACDHAIDVLNSLATLHTPPPVATLDVAAEMAAFEATYPLVDHAKYRDGEIIAGRVRYAEPIIDKMFSAWLSSRTPPPVATDAAINQNDAMRQELAHVGNLVSDLARAMGVDQANDDGSWPDLAARITKLIAAAPPPVATATVVDAGLRGHFRKMQEACANYIEPTTYVARFPDTSSIGDCKHVREFDMPDTYASAEGAAATNARRDQAFILDMIRMLDGPEERAALAATPTPTAGER